MIKKSFLLGVITSVIAINSVFADTIVTSKSYVDTTRQATIPASGTNANTPGETVVTYTDTAGTIGERGVCDVTAEENKNCENNYLVTRDLLDEQISNLGDQIEQATNLPTITTSKMTCVDSPDCTLWSVADQTVYGACKAYGESASDASECCSGAFNGGSTNCGCSSDEDCIDPDRPICVVSTHYCSNGSSK